MNAQKDLFVKETPKIHKALVDINQFNASRSPGDIVGDKALGFSSVDEAIRYARSDIRPIDDDEAPTGVRCRGSAISPNPIVRAKTIAGNARRVKRPEP